MGNFLGDFQVDSLKVFYSSLCIYIFIYQNPDQKRNIYQQFLPICNAFFSTSLQLEYTLSLLGSNLGVAVLKGMQEFESNRKLLSWHSGTVSAACL